MSTLTPLMRCAALACATSLLAACGEPPEPQWPWQPVSMADARVDMQFPCAPQFARTPVDFGMGLGKVPVHMMGCDAIDTTFAFSHWLLEDATQADDALAFWEAAVLSQFNAVDGKDAKSGAAFVPHGAMDIPRSIRATVEGVGRAGWTVTTHGAWFARQEGEGARIFHAVMYAPKPYHQTANTFFNSIALK